MCETTTIREIQGLLDQLRQGDPHAHDRLITITCDRLLRLTRKMLWNFPAVKKWEQTDDVFQNAVIRLRRALLEVRPASVNDFLGLAALQIRRELFDLLRHYQGRKGHAHAGPEPALGEGEASDSERPDSTHDPLRLAIWTEFHTAVENLPDAEREIVELLWYHEMSQEEAAELLRVDRSTVKRRWRSARLMLATALKGALPV